jgi:hypothetical protein
MYRVHWLLLAPTFLTVSHQHCSPATVDGPVGWALQPTVAHLIQWGVLAAKHTHRHSATVCRTMWCHGMMTDRGVGQGSQVGGGG